MNYTYIDTPQQLAACCEQFSGSQFLCVDTEFHREKTYYPELALIQIASESQAVCIDPLKLPDLQPLLKLLLDASIIKVFHAAQQDIEIFYHHFDTIPQPVFDTQIAATLLGYGDQIGYAALIKDALNIEVDKSQTRTDWMQRPLKQKQLDYAASDVIYLAQAYPLLVSQLNQHQRLDWLDDDFATLSNKNQYHVDVENCWKKVKGHQRLHGQQLAILQSIASWRETTAQQRNIPKRRIISDDVLIDIARQKTDSIQKILALRSINSSRINKNDITALATQVEKGLNQNKESWPSLPKKPKLTANDDALVDCLTGILKIQAYQHKISHSIIASRKQLEALARGERELPLLSGWRKHHGGKILLDFLDGKLSIQADSGKFSLHDQR